MTIHLGRLSPNASRDTPERRRTSPRGARSSWPFFSILHPVGFTVPSLLPGTRCALTAPFHPYPGMPGRFAFCGTFPRVAPAGH